MNDNPLSHLNCKWRIGYYYRAGLLNGLSPVDARMYAERLFKAAVDRSVRKWLDDWTAEEGEDES